MSGVDALEPWEVSGLCR